MASDDVPSLRRLKWVLLLALVGFLAILNYARYLLAPYPVSWQRTLLLDGLVVTGVLFFVGVAISVFTDLQERVVRRNDELLGLHEAAVDVYGDLDLETILQKVVARARILTRARYGALAITDRSGRIVRFVTSGIPAAVHRRIGDPPEGRGLLGVSLRQGESLRVPEIGDDPRSVGFPPGHPPMGSLLAVPIPGATDAEGAPSVGTLYVAEKENAQGFRVEDEKTLGRFATLVSIAIGQSRLHGRLRDLAVAEERLRIAREMHDGLAQVLAYVNTKAQAVSEFVRVGKTEQATTQLEELARAARQVSVDVREQILALRSSAGPERRLDQALRDFLVRWCEQTEIEGGFHGEPTRVPGPVQLQIVRIVQEVLANVRKHARASTVRLELAEADDGGLMVEVRDDGRGFHDADALARGDGGHFGLAIMGERAASIGARLVVDSEPGAGTRVRLVVPRDGVAEVASVGGPIADEGPNETAGIDNRREETSP